MTIANDSALIGLLDRARGGDDSARDELFRRCRNYVSVTAQAQLHPSLQAKFDASDLVQQTMLEAVRDWQGFRGATDGQWLAWLRKLLAHNAADLARHYHTEKRRPAREVSLSPHGQGTTFVFDPPASEPTPSQNLMQHERELRLADAIMTLPPDQQQVVVLRNLHRLPFEEIAREMDRSRPAVQMLWVRALRKLQEVLDS